MSEQILATDKVKRETGLAHVFASLNILCPYGQKALRGAKPFMPGQEEQLRAEFERIREIGEIMGKTENWARVTYYRGKERLRKELDNESTAL